MFEISSSLPACSEYFCQNLLIPAQTACVITRVRMFLFISSSCTMTNQKKTHMHIYKNNTVLTSKSWSCRLMGSEKTKEEKRERRGGGGGCTTVMTTQICFDSFWPTELSKKHLMLKWGQEKVKKRYMSAVMNISTADLKILAVFMREVARVTSFSLSCRWAALALTTTGF